VLIPCQTFLFRMPSQSPQPASTDDSSLTLSSSSTSPEKQKEDFHSYRDLSGSDILYDIQKLRSEGIHYAGTEDLSSQCEFIYNKAVKGDVLVPKNSDNKLTEFIITGVFEISPRNFFMTSDGKWNPNNLIGTRFDQIKPSCLLLPVDRDPDFSFSSTDFPQIISNLHAIENLGNPRKSRDIFSLITTDPNQPPSIKLTHHLFIVRLFQYLKHPTNLSKKKRKKIK
jgi:hypothetical protein